jgi:hypothetical protein
VTTAETESVPRIKSRECECHKIPRVPLFEVERDDADEGAEPRVFTDEGAEPRVFTVPEYFEGHVTLDYLEMLESRGSDAAFRWAMITALGRDGWVAMRSPGMDDETFGTIGRAVLDKIRGANKRGPKAQS